MADQQSPYAEFQAPAKGAASPYAEFQAPAARPAGLPAGVDLPQPAAHPAVTMTAPQTIQESFDSNTAYSPNDPLLKKVIAGSVNGAGSLLVHPYDTVKGIAKSMLLPVGDNAPKGPPIPWSDTVKQLPYTAGQLIGNTALGAAGGELLPRAAGAVSDIVPTKAKAGAMFEDLNKNLENQPVTLTNTMPHINRVMTLGKEGGGSPPLAVRQLSSAAGQSTPRSVPLLRAMQNDLSGAPAAEAEPKPLLFPSARNFQSGLASLSRDDSGGMSGPMKGSMAQLNKGLYQDIRDAAEQQGRGADFDKAMKSYGRAATIQDGLQWAKDHAIQLVGGGAAASYVAHKLLPGK